MQEIRQLPIRNITSYNSHINNNFMTFVTMQRGRTARTIAVQHGHLDVLPLLHGIPTQVCISPLMLLHNLALCNHTYSFILSFFHSLLTCAFALLEKDNQGTEEEVPQLHFPRNSLRPAFSCSFSLRR